MTGIEDAPQGPSGKNFASIAREADPTIDIKELNRIQKLLGKDAVNLIEEGYEDASSRHTEGEDNE